MDEIYKKYNEFLLSIGLNIEQIEDINNRWSESWRFYHDVTHLCSIISKIEKLSITDNEKNILIESAFFHDIVYIPWDITPGSNEKSSVDIYKKMVKYPKQEVIDIIIDTSNREVPSNKLSSIFWKIDNSIISESNISDLMIYESKIRKEFQFIDYSIYKIKRIEFLKSCIGNSFGNDYNLNFLIKYIEYFRPKIGIYPGSFNPFHKGHLAILNRAEQIFDKVIVCIGSNPDKDNSGHIEKLRKSLIYREVDIYDGLTTKYMDKKSENADITLIRGLRNGADLDYESDQLRFMEDIEGKKINVIYLPCEIDYSHISSSRIRSLISGGYSKEANRYLP